MEIKTAKEKKHEYDKKYREEHFEEISAKQKAYRDSHKEQYQNYYKNRIEIIKEQKRQRYALNKDKIHQRYIENRDHRRAVSKARRDALKQEVMDKYGGKCVCCGESEIVFLCIDHVHGNGNIERRESKRKGGHAFFLWLLKNACPPDYQILCYNCNNAKRIVGICPHQR